MIHNRLKFTTGSSWLSVSGLDWRLSQPGFDPSYGKLVCLATLMSSDRTKQICLWMTIYIYIYIFQELGKASKRFRRKRPALFKSGQWHFHQDNAPVHSSILVTDYLTKMGIRTVRHPPDSPDLASCVFWLFLSTEAVVMRQLRRWKRLWQRSLTRSHKRTSMGSCRSGWNSTIVLQPEEITSKGTRVSYVYYQ